MMPLSTQTHSHSQIYNHNYNNNKANLHNIERNRERNIEKTPPRVIFSKLLIYIEIINQKGVIFLKYWQNSLKNK